MEELRKSGPLDKVRQLNEDASVLDAYVHLEDLTDNTMNLDMFRLLGDLDAEHPLHDQEVIVYGRTLTSTIDEDTMMPMSLPRSDTPEDISATRGIYHGFDARKIYIPDNDDMFTAIVHVIEVGKDSYLDEYHNQHDVTLLNYVIAQGSEVVPVLPLNAHSLKRLEGSKTMQEFDHILYQDDSPRESKIRDLVRYANAVFSLQPDNIETNFQRVSFLNSSGIIDGVEVESNNFIIVDRDGYIDGTAVPTLSTLDSSAAIGSPIIDILPGYERHDTHTIKTDLEPELFAATAVDDKWLAIPLKTARTIKDLGVVDG